jgi:Raf kinase inhibitor-like YbhB/YbcL family protein
VKQPGAGCVRTPSPWLARSRLALTVGLLGLLCGCDAEGPTAGENTAGAGAAAAGGSNAGTGAGAAGGMGAIAGNGGAAAGGAAATSNGGAAAGGAAATGNGGAAGGGISAGGNSGAAGSGGTPPVSGAGNGGSGGAAGAGQGGGTFVLTSPAFDGVAGCSVENPKPCDVFPDENVSYMGNANISPELRWTSVPPGTQSLALVLVDATFGQAHWVLWNIPANITMLAANVPKDTAMPAVPAGARQTNANFAAEGDGYFGPHIPCNVFQFELHALSTSAFSPKEPQSAGLVYIELQELGDDVLGIAKLTGRSNDYMMTCE